MQRINYLIKYLVYKFYTLFPIQKNKVVCNNFMKKGYGDNPKYVVKHLENKNLDIVWACKNEYNNTLPKFIRPSNKWYKYLYDFATAKVWVSNVRLPGYITKRKNQYYIQTWHGGLGFKKIEMDVMTKALSKRYLKDALKDSRQMDLLITDCEFITKIQRRAFRYDGKVLELGLPRTDIFFEKDKNALKEKFNLSGYKILLYAPTFRKNNTKEVYNIDFDSVLKKLNRGNEKWKVLVKLHPNIDNPEDYFKFNENILNFTSYNDINELFFITDIFITDYSSCLFDIMYLNKPSILYTPDFEDYKKERDFYIEIETLGIPQVYNNNELINLLSNIKSIKYDDIFDSIRRKYKVKTDGTSGEKVAKIILDKMGE